MNKTGKGLNSKVPMEHKTRIEVRRQKVFANLLSGLSYRQMGEALGCSIGTISRDVQVVLGRLKKQQIQDADEWVQIELSRVDAALNAIWNIVIGAGDIERDLGAVDRMVKLLELRCTYLGLFAPERRDITSGGEPLLNIERWKTNREKNLQDVAQLDDDGETIDA